ncbi:S-layer homology domain-containing protein [Monoglobus pectinilyticus]|uniref:S-layer homology domain-containing protein n=1 Tax=Monoglobus pectinilyticus TaxID=1981510 RepID=UPI002A752E4E|nr:S-layer homology domain-containing protein [Monoglobus pectinilyticus]
MRTFKRSLALVLAIAMVLTTFGMTVVSAAQYNDTEGHWAESYINTWSGYGVIQGDGGYFRPDDAITRAEVAQVTDNVISYEKIADNMFTDVSTTDWFADAVLKLVAAGTLTGNGDGTMTPNNYMTREEAMTMLARAYGLTVENTQAGITQYADYQNISDYATGYVGAMTAAGYVGGYEDGTIRPKDYISRAEFVKIIDNMIKLYITEPGSYGPEYVGGIVMIKTGGVTLNGIVAGGVVVSPQVSGDVTITGSQISGDIVNLSEKANVTSNTGNVTNPSATTKPNNIVIGGGGSGGGGNGGGPASLTVKFHYGENYGTVKTKSVTKGKKLSESSVPTPTESNWDGLWYTSKSAAEKCSGTTFDPTVSAVNKNYDLYAGHINNYDLKDVEIAVDNKTDYVNVYVGDVLTATNLAPAAAKNYVSYQWYRTKESNGTGDKISGATKSTYTAVEADKGMYLKVVVTGDGTNYNGTVSDVSTIVLAKDAPSIYPEKTTAAFGNDAATTVTLTEGQTITGVKTESGEMLTADQYTFDAETGKLTISKDYLAGLTDGQNVFTIVVSDDAAYNVTFVVTTTGGPTEGPVPTEEPEPTATPVTPDKPTATPVTPDKPTATPVTPDKPTATPVTPDKPTATPVTPDKPTATPVTPDKPTATPVTPDEPTATPLPTATVAPIQKYVATVNVTGGKAVLKDANGNTYPLVEVSNPTEEPVPTATASTEEPTEAPATAKPTMPPLTEITESYTFIADDFNSAGTLPISEGTMLDNGKVYSPAGNNAATNKKSSEINGASHLNSMRLKGAQNSLVFKTAVDVAVTVYGNAHDSRVYAAGTTNGGVELGKGQTGSGVFTFNASAGTTVYLTAVNDADNSGGDLFIAGFTVEPTANAAAEDGAVQYLIPEGDVVTVDATPDTAGLYPIVTVKGADGQDIAVSDNKFTMPGQNVTTEVTFGDAPATATPAPTATVSPEPTATATVAPPTATPVFPSYANWNIGQAKIDTTDGAAAEVVYPAEGGKAAIEVTSRNIYTTLDQEVSAGQANVSLDVYIDPAVPKNFRIYLESGTENYQNPNGEYVFAEVANNNNLSVNYGPNPAEENKLFDYSQMTAGWYKFNITLDYEGTDFITLEVKAPDGTVAGTAKMGAIAGKSTALRQVRLIQTAAAAQFADMAITVSGQPTATPAPSTPSPTAVPVSSIVVPANDLTLDGGAVLSDNAGQNYTWTEKATDEMKSTFGDPIDSVNTAKFALMNGDGRNVSKTINIPADGEYKLMVMSIEYNNRYFTASVDNGAAIEPESQTPGKMATNNAGGSNVDLTVTEYNLGTLTNGEHTVKVTSAANNSRNILAIAVVPVAAPATPDPSATPEPNKYIATVNVTGGTAVLKDAEGNVYPTYAPEATVAPTVEPTAEPSDAPTAEPSDAPTDEPAATATTAPVTPVTYKYTSTSEIKGGNLCEGDTCTFVDEASEEIRTLFADGSDAAKVAPALTANYKNYVGGTGSKASQPYIEGINLEPGTYNVYYLGYNNEVAIDATIGDISFSIPAASGVPVAREDNNASRVLKAYKFTFTAETALTNATLTFNTTEQWLPDIFSVILTNTTVAANAAGVDGAVQYLIPEGDVVKVDATAETAGQVASVTVTGADGQDVKVENNKFTMPGQNVTADITFAEAPATATPEATAAPTAKPAEVMIAGDMTLNGSAKVYNDAPKEPTAAYTEEYSNIFGENFSKAGTSKVGFLGSNFGGYVTKNYTIDETGSYKAYIMVSYAQNNNQFALSKDGTQVVQGTLVDKSEKVGTNGQDLFIYTYDIDNLEAGTYEFKYYSELGQCSDFVAAAIVAAEAPATATPAPATETPEPTEAPATETPVPSATATPTEAPATETPAPTDAPVSTIAPIPAKGMTLPSGVNTTDKSSKIYNWNDKATDEMKAVFGDPLTGVNTEALVPMGAADRTISAKINVSAEQAGSYKLMVLGIEYSNRYYNVKVDSGNAIAPENTNPGKVALIDPTESNSDLTITTYDLGELTEGEHTISVISAANNSRDFFAMGFVKYTPAPATETPAPTEEPATATPEPSATAEPTEAPATETPAPSATAMPIDDYIKANLDDVNSQLVDGDVQYAQLVPNYDNSTVDVEVLDGTIKNMSVVKSIEAAIGLVNKYDPVAKYAVHYDGSDYATVSAANEAATNFDTVDNRPDGYKNYNPVTVFGKDDSPSAIAIGKAVSASLGLNTEQFNSISTTDLATFLGYLEANSKYSVNVTAYGADGNSIFTYKFTFADKQPAPSATAEPTAEPTVTPTATPLVVTADEMTLFGQVSRSSFTSFSDPTEYYTEEYSSLFGQNFEKAGTSKIAFNAGSGASCSYEFSISEAGSYVFYFMGATNLGEGGKFTLTRGSTTIVDGKDLVNSQVFGKLNEQNSSKDILIAKYQFNDLEEGNYKITMRPTAGSWGGTLNNRDFVALAIAKTETPQTTATPEPTAEPTEAPTAEPTAEPTEAPTMAPVTIVTAESGMSTSNGGKTADVAFKDITADYTGVYPVIFGENLSKAGAKKMGFLGGSSHNYTTMSYEIPEDGLYKVYMLVYNPNNGNSMSLTKSGSSTPAFDAHLIDMSPQLASASDGYAIKALTYTVALTAGTYTAKYYRTDTSFCSDPIAFAIAPVSEAAANAATVNVTDVAGASAELLDSNGIAYEGDIPEGDVVEIKTSDVTGYAVSVSVTAGGIQIPLTADNKFIMPNQAVTVDVVYNALRSVSVSATGGSVELYNAADNSVIDPANYNSIPEGTVIGITATPDVAEQVAEITVVGATLDTDKNLFTVGDSNVEVTVEFVTPTKYNVNLDAYTNGSVSSDKATAAEGEKVTLTVTPNSGYVTQEVYVVDETQAAETITSTDITKYTFTMPAYDVTIGAIFAQVTGYVEYLFDGSHNTSINSTTAPAITYQGGTHPTPVFTLTNTSKSYGVATALDIKGKLPLSGTSISWNKKASKGSNGAGYFIDLGLVDSYADQNCQIFTMLSPNSVADTTIAKLEGANAGKFGTITAAAAMAEGVFRGIDASDAQADGTIKLTYGNKQGLVYYIAIAYYTPVVQ